MAFGVRIGKVSQVEKSYAHKLHLFPLTVIANQNRKLDSSVSGQLFFGKDFGEILETDSHDNQ